MSRFRNYHKRYGTANYVQLYLIGIMEPEIPVPNRILSDELGQDVDSCIRAFSERSGCEVVELNVQIDHVHLIAMVPTKIATSDYLGIKKGRRAIRILNKYKQLRQNPYWGNHFGSRGYCADTVGLDSKKIRQYEKHQEAKERKVVLDLIYSDLCCI